MYSYKKKKRFPKRSLMVFMSCLCMCAAAYLTYEYTVQNEKAQTPVFNEDTSFVLKLPQSDTIEKGVLPFSAEAKVVLDYYDGSDTKVASLTKFEGVYRGNQGMDYAFNDEAFDVLASFSGEVTDVKDDNIFGKTVTVKSDELTITYQSLSEIAVKKGDKLKQKAIIGKAGTNIYNKDLGNHLHIVVEKNKVLIDPELIFNKALKDIK